MATSPADDLTEVDLLGATLGRGALALIGAGASVASGYPSWTALLSALEIRIKALVSDQSVSPKLKVVLDKLRDPAWYAEELVRRLGQEAFHVFVQETFRAPVPPQCISQAHTLLASLPFRHYLTTNYDPCMEEALIQNKRECRPIHWNDDAHVEDFFGVLSDPRAEPCVVYLHGRFDRPADVILTETSYRIYLDDVFQRRLLAIFMTQPVVFVGFSMADLELAQLMRVVRATVGAGTARHFGIFGYHTTDERELIQRRMRDKFGVRAVFYKVTDKQGEEDHSELLGLLHNLGLHEKVASVRGASVGTVPFDAPASRRSLSFSSGSRPAAPSTVDPHKGQFGGSPAHSGRVLSVENVRVVEQNAYMAFDVVVKAEPGAPPLKGKVRFQLHPTFAEDDYDEPVRNGVARSRIRASYGAFTVGVTCDGEKTKLELDLSELGAFPDWFRER